MATTMVHIRLDEEVKEKATLALAQMGLSVSDAIRVFLTRVAAEQRLPFEIRVPNSVTREAMAEAEEIAQGRSARFGSVEEVINELEKKRRK